MNRPIERLSSPVLLVVTAPSGAGKTTVGRNLIETTAGLERAVTCTTRSRRAGEQDGVDYHFLGLEDFEQRVGAGAFLEHARVYGNRYGTLKSEVLERLARGADVLLSVDVQGAEVIRGVAEADPVLRAALVTVFLMPPSMDELERRLRGRNQDPPEVMARRLAVARDEIEHWPHFDYLVVSGRVEDDLAAMQRVLAAEKLRSARVRRCVVP